MWRKVEKFDVIKVILASGVILLLVVTIAVALALSERLDAVASVLSYLLTILFIIAIRVFKEDQNPPKSDSNTNTPRRSDDNSRDQECVLSKRPQQPKCRLRSVTISLLVASKERSNAQTQ